MESKQRGAQLNVYLPQEDAERVRRQANRLRIALGTITRIAVLNYLDTLEREESSSLSVLART
jgi:hypothetical protein